MKTILSLLLLLCVMPCAFAQLNNQNKQDDIILVSVGYNLPFYNNGAFDAWTARHYSTVKNPHPNVSIDVAVIGKMFAFGGTVDSPSPLSLYRGYFGVKLFGHDKSISSWLNLQVGEVYAKFSDIAPLNYNAPSYAEGQKMELHYNAGYIGLEWRNYLNFLHFNLGSRNFVVPFNVGFYISGGITPFAQHWHYGYNTGDNSDDSGGSSFVSTQVTDIPKLSHYYANTGLFLAF